MISVLYVDDEPDLLELGKLFLEATGDFSISTRGSAEKALDLLKAQSFDLVLSDYSMPDMDGIAFLKAIRSLPSGIPFILFTGRGREEVVVEAINNGADFYMQKGGDARAQFSELAHKIRHAVMRKRAEAELADSREYLSRIFASVKTGIMVIDAATHTIIDVKPTAAELIGLPKEEITGKDCHSYVCPAETGKCPILDPGQTVDNSERILLTATGARIPIIKYVTRVKLSGRDCLLETFIDNTQRRTAEDELRTAYEELKLNREENVAAYSELAANEQILMNDYAEMLRQERNRLFPDREAKSLSREFDLLVIPGIEGGNIAVQKHWIALGIHQEIPATGIEDVLTHIHKQNGLAIAPHPHARLGFPDYAKLGFDAVEGILESVRRNTCKPTGTTIPFLDYLRFYPLYIRYRILREPAAAYAAARQVFCDVRRVRAYESSGQNCRTQA